MIQQLHILQLTTVELVELIQKKSLENPLIDTVEDGIEKLHEWPNRVSTKGQVASQDQDFLFVQSHSVKDFLYEQIPLNIQQDERVILNYLIDSLDERLFLGITKEEICQQFDITSMKAQELIDILQSFEPVGVGAADITQFLIMHINLNEHAPRLAEEFVLQEIKAMAKMDIINLSKRYRISVDEVLETIEFIKRLPRTPAITLEETALFVIPDASVHKIGEQWVIELEDWATPKIQLNDLYVELLKSESPDYLKDCMRDYVTLVQGIDFRKNTVYRLLEYMVEHQSPFFEQGLKTLKPMRLKDIADALDLHESTISRAVKGKYLQTAFGTIAFQELFVQSIGNSTTSNILDEIVAFIKNEPKDEPYSDQQLVGLLQQKGIKISRRTVAKYREQLNIPSSQKRVHFQMSKE